MKAPSNSLQAFFEALHFAALKHANQRRKGVAAEPYINHLIEVAELVCGALNEPDANLVIAALLHDAIEDQGVTREELAQRFGAEVADLVAEVTDDKSLPKEERKRLQIENAPKKSAGAQAIQLADKISNLRGIADSPPADWDKQRKIEYVAYALSGDNAKAKTAYQDFLALWKNADPDIPILIQAKAEYAKLQ